MLPTDPPEHLNRPPTRQPESLPLPELNPLVNPLLGEHMGRWAEVYFTAAPEKREEAVLALLRELESERRMERGEEKASGFSSFDSGSFTSNADSQTAPVCSACGHENPTDQKFCGMCGVGLREEPAPARRDSMPPSSQPSFLALQDTADDVTEPGRGQDWLRRRREVDARDGSHLDHLFEPEPPSYRFWAGIGVAVVILLAGLAYLSWRGRQTSSGVSQGAPSASPVAKEPVQPALSKGTQPSASGAADVAAESGSAPPAHATEPASTRRAPLPARENRTPARAAAASSENVRQGGAPELATAEDYLNGTNGRQRDRAAAAVWLWQAVEKQNTEATMLLADLYLRGDGVEKNCDQARVLLDAAALKGRKEASFRLQHLQAFGCQ